MTERNQTQTPREPAQNQFDDEFDNPGGLPIDHANVDDKGNTDITGRQDDSKKAMDGDNGAQDGEPDDKGADEKPSTPAPKTFSEEEVTRLAKSLKDGHEGTVKKMRQELADARKELERIRDEQEENQWASFLNQSKEGGVPEDIAQRFVDRAKTLSKAERDFAKRIAQLEERESLLNEAGKSKKAYDLIKEHGLGEDMATALLEAEDEKEMELKALRLRLESVTAASKPKENVPQGLGAQPGIEWDKLSDSQRMGRALEIEDRRMRRGK